MRRRIFREDCFKATNECIVAPLGRNCETTIVLIGAVSTFNKGTTAALFLARVLAVYPRNHFVRAIFVILWGVVVGGNTSSMLVLPTITLGPTKYCISLPTRAWKTLALFAAFADAIFDLLVCAAIIYQMREFWVGGGEIDERHRHPRWLWFPARRSSKIADRFTRDSQTYVL